MALSSHMIREQLSCEQLSYRATVRRAIVRRATVLDPISCRIVPNINIYQVKSTLIQDIILYES